MAVERSLPGKKFVYRQSVAFACLFQAQKSTANRGHELGFAPHHPALRVARREVGYGEDMSVRPDNVARPVLALNGHGTRYSLSVWVANVAKHDEDRLSCRSEFLANICPIPGRMPAQMPRVAQIWMDASS
jgi:hypothetical protein